MRYKLFLLKQLSNDDLFQCRLEHHLNKNHRQNNDIDNLKKFIKRTVMEVLGEENKG